MSVISGAVVSPWLKPVIRFHRYLPVMPAL